MKKIIKVLSLIGISTVLCSCGNGNGGDNGGDSGDKVQPITPKEQGVLNINYLREDGNYDDWALWIWAENKDGAEYQFTLSGDYGAICQLDLSDDYFKDSLDGEFGIIVKSRSKGSSIDWSKKDIESDRYFSLSSMSKVDGYYNMYLVTQDETIYYDSSLVSLERINMAILTVDHEMKFSTSKAFDKYELYEDETVIKTEEGLNKTFYSISMSEYDFKIGSVYKVKIRFKESQKIKEKEISTSVLMDSDDFANKYNYAGELGAIYTKTSTTFKVWSPIASKIVLNVYDNGTPTKVDATKGSDNKTSYEMSKGDKAVYSYVVGGDLEGKYYTYTVYNNINAKNGVEIVDPYAKSTGVNGLRGMIVDFSKTNPDGWDSVDYLNVSNKELTVYETHVQDITSSSTWSSDTANSSLSKTYLGAQLAGTTYTSGSTTVKTGFDHIKELGVNAVQLLPIFDQDNDETTKTFNWGYNPLNYNSLEGSYSSDPYDGYAKIREFKQLVKSYNSANMTIIMDVVYNHVSSLENSNFNYLMPKYYFRYSSGVASNGSGCGNETNSNRYMFKKFMIDSTSFWMKEYKLGGFRFDLMGLHDVDTMKELSSTLKTINPSATVYGEPWTGGTSPIDSGVSASQANISKYDGYGAFNDQMRDALIKGGLNDKKEKGWVNNTSINSNDVKAIEGGLGGKLVKSGITYSSDVDKNVQYVTCHDNYTLYDRMKAAGISDEDLVKKMCVLANSLVFTSKGTTFMLAGEEFLRTKQGNSNSYNASFQVNELDYSLKAKNMDVFANYQKMIKFKQETKALHSTNTDETVKQEVTTLNNGATIVNDIKDETNNVAYKIAYNNGVAGEETVNFEGYNLYLDTLNDSSLTLTNSTKLKAYQTIIAYKNIA